MNIEKLKPISAYIAKRIKNRDNKNFQYGNVRFYAYFTKMKGELIKITVACKTYKNQWFCKQVAVHGVHSEICYVKDLEYTMMGYSVGWYSHGLTDQRKYYENGKWQTAADKYYDPIAEVINKKFALKFDAYKYSVIDKYPYYDVFKYLRTYEQYPQAEYFIKLGLQHLATNKTLLKKAGKDKNFRKWLVKYAKQLRNEYGNYPYFSAQVMLSAYKTDMTLLEAQRLEREKKELLENYPFVLLSNITHGRRNFDAFLRSQNISFKPTYEFNSYSLCRELIKNGFGIGVGNPIHYKTKDFIVLDTDFSLPKRTFDIGYIKTSKNECLKDFISLISNDEKFEERDEYDKN